VLVKALAAGGLATALLASTCCVVPLSLTALGIGSASLSSLAILAPYQTTFRVVAIVMLGAAFWLVYRPKQPQVEGAACTVTPTRRSTKAALWAGAVLIGLAVTTSWWERFIV